jgi:hypothetical protein
MSKPDESLPYGRLTRSCAHLCIDMQNLFPERTDWHTPWMARVLPVGTYWPWSEPTALGQNRYAAASVPAWLTTRPENAPS